MAKRRYFWDDHGNLQSRESWLWNVYDFLGFNPDRESDRFAAMREYASDRGTTSNPTVNKLQNMAVIWADVAPYLNARTGLSLSEKEWQDLLEADYSPDSRNLFVGGTDYSIDVAQLDADVQEMLNALANYDNELPLLQDYLTDARAQIDAENAAEFAELDRLLSQQQDLYNDQLKSLSDSYNYARSNLLSQQQQQNSQLMDTLQSGMERSRRNALESGASAGIRIADNINTLLSVQNKQSASSMETANQLSQMMINQRNAEAAARRDYSAYLQSDNAQRSNLRLSANDRASSLADLNYTAAKDAYTAKQNEFDEKYKINNPMYKYRKQLYDANQRTKSKFSGGN